MWATLRGRCRFAPAIWPVARAVDSRPARSRRRPQLAALARSERVLVNVEDRPALCDFHSVAEVRRGDLLLTVSTGGASPGLAARIRARLAAEFGPEWAERVALLRGHRAAWRQRRPRRGGAHRRAAAGQRVAGMTFEPGTVWLVGAGPGDPGLLTLHAARALAEADVVLHDALVSPEILALAAQARLEPVGKRAGGRPHAAASHQRAPDPPGARRGIGWCG